MKSLPFSLWRFWLLALVAGYVIAGYLWTEIPDDKLHIWFFDIGQGDSALIKTPENHQILIDGGPGNKVLLALADALPFYDRQLDMVILTHPHEDHIAGLIEVLKRFDVQMVLLTGVNSNSGSYDEFLEEMLEKKIDFVIADQFTDFRFGDVEFDVLYPIQQMLLEDKEELNDSSIVLRMISDKVRVLFTGDLEAVGEQELIDHHAILRSDILKVGHHGSKTSSTMAFLIKVKPDMAVISAGRDNKFGHPNEKILQNLRAAGVKEIWRTDVSGTLELVY